MFCLHTVKCQNSSILNQFSVSTFSMSKTVPFQTIQFTISLYFNVLHFFKSNSCLDTPYQNDLATIHIIPNFTPQVSYFNHLLLHHHVLLIKCIYFITGVYSVLLIRIQTHTYITPPKTFLIAWGVSLWCNG